MRKLFTTLTALALAASVFSQTPYARYPFDGNANDVSGNSLNGTLQGSPANGVNRYNQAGKCLIFDGTTDYVTLPEDFDFANRSIVVWFNASQIPAGNNGGVVYNSDHNGINNGQTYVLVKNNGNNKEIQMGMDNALYYSIMNTNEWYQVAMVRTPANIKFYVNGVEVYSFQNPNGSNSTNGVSYAVVGADRGFNAKFIGRIDDLSIYNTAMSDSAVLNNYSSISSEIALEEKTKATALNGQVLVQIDNDLLPEVQSVVLTDLSGRIISEKNPEANFALNNTALPAGTYVVSFTHKKTGRTVGKKVVVQ